MLDERRVYLPMNQISRRPCIEVLLFLERDGRGREYPEDIVIHTDLRIGEPAIEKWVASLGGGQVENRRMVKCRGRASGSGRRCTQEVDDDG